MPLHRPLPARPTARELGLALGTLPPGPRNGITDVPGVRVGHATVVHGEGPLVPGQGPARTGVTAVLPHSGNLFREKVPAGAFVLNGFGKSAGLIQVMELGTLETPVLLTSTLAVGRCFDALVDWAVAQSPEIGVRTGTVNPVVLECNDGYLNDIQGRHVTGATVQAALAAALSPQGDGPVQQGAVGAGTGMVAFGVKGGIGSASRRLPPDLGGYTVGVLALANFGRWEQLVVAGVPVGRRLPRPQAASGAGAPPPGGAGTGGGAAGGGGPAVPTPPDGSVILVAATDAPLDARGLERLARRAALGIARTGGTADHGSGDIALAFSTAYRIPHDPAGPLVHIPCLTPGPTLNLLFRAAAEAAEEAILNALFTAVTVTGRDGHVAPALPVEEVLALCR